MCYNENVGVSLHTPIFGFSHKESPRLAAGAETVEKVNSNPFQAADMRRPLEIP